MNNSFVNVLKTNINMELESQRLKLIELTEDDIKNIHQLHSYPEVDEFNTLGIPEDISVTKEMIDNIIKEEALNPRKSYHWKIIIKETNEFIGAAGLFLSNDKFKLGEIYYKLMPSRWGRGYATEVAKTLVKNGFEIFGLHKVEAGVATENIMSVKVLEKIGMTREGLRRKILPIRGEWKDNYHYAIVEDDPRDY